MIEQNELQIGDRLAEARLSIPPKKASIWGKCVWGVFWKGDGTCLGEQYVCTHTSMSFENPTGKKLVDP